MLLQFLSLQKPPLLLSPFSIINKHRISISRTNHSPSSSSSSSSSVRAVEKDSEFEVDPDKARDALRKLDQELQSLSQKRARPPMISATNIKRARDQMKEEAPELSGSFLASLFFSLFLFQVFYNILFLTVIKPAIDGPEENIPETTAIGEAPEVTVLQQLPLIPAVSIKP